MHPDQPTEVTTRFTDRAGNYAKYRPTYPAEIVDHLEQNGVIGMAQGLVMDEGSHVKPHPDRIADIGSGTGIFSLLLLQWGYPVTGIEPNDEMRKAAGHELLKYPGFQSLPGTAEHTGLEKASINLVTAAQAFHWFDPVPVKSEFGRILAPGGHVLLLWNILQRDNAFLSGYHTIKETYAEDLEHPYRANEEKIKEFFSPADTLTKEFRHSQLLGREELAGYLQSFSTVPLAGSAGHEQMLQDLDELFAAHNINGKVEMNYITFTYLSRVN